MTPNAPGGFTILSSLAALTRTNVATMSEGRRQGGHEEEIYRQMVQQQ